MAGYGFAPGTGCNFGERSVRRDEALTLLRRTLEKRGEEEAARRAAILETAIAASSRLGGTRYHALLLMLVSRLGSAEPGAASPGDLCTRSDEWMRTRTRDGRHEEERRRRAEERFAEPARRLIALQRKRGEGLKNGMVVCPRCRRDDMVMPAGETNRMRSMDEESSYMYKCGRCGGPEWIAK